MKDATKPTQVPVFTGSWINEPRTKTVWDRVYTWQAEIIARNKDAFVCKVYFDEKSYTFRQFESILFEGIESDTVTITISARPGAIQIDVK